MLIKLSAFCFRWLLAALVILFIISCSTNRHVNTEKPLGEIKIGLNSNQVKLRSSKFYLIVPDNYDVKEAREKEGQHGFWIASKNTSSQIYGFIEIQHGHPLSDSIEDDCKNVKVYTQSILLGTRVTWIICDTAIKFFNVRASHHQGITVVAYSDNKMTLIN